MSQKIWIGKTKGKERESERKRIIYVREIDNKNILKKWKKISSTEKERKKETESYEKLKIKKEKKEEKNRQENEKRKSFKKKVRGISVQRLCFKIHEGRLKRKNKTWWKDQEKSMAIFFCKY